MSDVDYRTIEETDKTNEPIETPTHLRVSSVTLRIDTDEPLIVGAIEAGKTQLVELPPDADGNPRSATIFVPMAQCSAALRGSDLEQVLDTKLRQKIREALIANAKATGALEKII